MTKKRSIGILRAPNNQLLHPKLFLKVEVQRKASYVSPPTGGTSKNHKKTMEKIISAPITKSFPVGLLYKTI